MKAIPDISVVMGVYNNADTLSAALDSILSQEGVELEFVVIDDGSTDGSASILDEAAKTDPRLRVVHKKNEGLTRALIDGCALATAPWIARQDADDVSLPGRLRAQLERAQQPDAPDLVACGAVWQSPEGATLFDAIPPLADDVARRQILKQGETPCPHGAILMRTDSYRLAGGYREQFYLAQDLDLITRLSERGRIAIVPQIFYGFRFSPGSISGRYGKRQAEYRRLARKSHAARMKGKSEQKWLREAQALSDRLHSRPMRKPSNFGGLYFIGCCLRRRAPDLARSYLAQAWQRRPWSLPAFLRWLEIVVGRALGDRAARKEMALSTDSGDAITFPVPMAHRGNYLLFAASRRVHRLAVAWGNRRDGCDVRVVGAYFAGNLGDWTMGQMMLRAGRFTGQRPGLFDYAHPGNPKLPLIMGGGELGNAAHFEQAIRCSRKLDAVAACGIQPTHDFANLPRELLDRISRFAYLSARSKAGAELMQRVLSRPDVEYCPDLAFGLRDSVRIRTGGLPVRSRPVLGINAMTFYLSVQERRCFAPDRSLIPVVADPHFATMLETAGGRYAGCMRQLAKDACARGWEVVSIPFSSVDAMWAEVLWQGLPVRRLPFSRDPFAALRRLEECDKWVAARFHAHVFGLMARVPTVSMAYAGKCQYLWRDLGFGSERQISRMDLCADPSGIAKRILDEDGVVLPVPELERLAGAARRDAEQAFRSVGAGGEEEGKHV